MAILQKIILIRSQFHLLYCASNAIDPESVNEDRKKMNIWQKMSNNHIQQISIFSHTSIPNTQFHNEQTHCHSFNFIHIFFLVYLNRNKFHLINL